MLQIKWVWKNLKGMRAQFITGIALSLVYALMSIINPYLSSLIVDNVIVGTVNEAGETVRNMDYLVPVALSMIGVTFAMQVANYFGIVLSDTAGQGFIYNMRKRLYQNMQNQEMSFFDLYRTGDLMTRLTGDLDMVRHAIAYIFRQLLVCIVLFLSGSIAAFVINPRFAVCLVIVTPIIFLLSSTYFKKIRPCYVQVRNSLSDLNTCAQENIEGNRVIKAFASEKFENDQFRAKNKAFYDINLETNLVWLKFYPYIEFFAQYMSIGRQPRSMPDDCPPHTKNARQR